MNPERALCVCVGWGGGINDYIMIILPWYIEYILLNKLDVYINWSALERAAFFHQKPSFLPPEKIVSDREQ